MPHNAPVTARPKSTDLLRFGVFELDAASGEIRRAGRRLRLAPQPFEALLLLASRAGETVTRDEIRHHLWPDDTFVDFDTAMSSCVRKIRRVLDDSAQSPRFLETLPRRGYRFIAPVETVNTDDPPSDLPSQHRPLGQRPLGQQSLGQQALGLRLWLSAVAGLLVVMLAGLVFSRARRSAPIPLLGKPRLLAVMPFESLGNDETYFSDGLTEEVITSLGRLDATDLRVLARGSTLRLRESDKTPGEIGRDLGVEFLMQGSVRWSANQVRISASLIRTDDQTQLWSESYDYNPSDAFAVQSEVSSRLTAAVLAALTPPLAVTPGSPRRTTPEASEAYLKGRYHLHQWTADGAAAAVTYFERASRLDATFASAQASLATAHNMLRFTRRATPAEAHPRARVAAEKALTLNPDLAEAYLALSTVELFYDWDLEAAGHSARRTLRLAPGMAKAHSHYAAWLAARGRHEEAIESARMGQRLDPLTQSVAADLCWYFNYASRFDEAITECSRALEMEPEHSWSQWGLQEAYRQLGRTREALSAAPLIFGSPRAADEDPSEALSYLVRHRLTRMLELQGERHIDPFTLAVMHALADEPELSLDQLERAVDERSWWVVYLLVDPRLGTVRGNPRFDSLARRVGLVE